MTRIPLRESLLELLAPAAPQAESALTRRERLLLAAAMLAAAGWVAAAKLKVFFGLGMTSDIFQFTQLATTWLQGRFLHDNCYGEHLTIHTYLLCPLLAVLVVPFGAVGLLLAQGLAAGAFLAAAVRLLRDRGVPFVPALVGAALVGFMPLAVHVIQDDIYGFHVELLEPAFAVWLAYFLLRRRWVASLGMAIPLIAIKEDAPLLVFVVALLVLLEDWTGQVRQAGWRVGEARMNRPALGVLGLALVAVPVLLLFLQSQPHAAHSAGNFQRLSPVGGGSLTGLGSLLAYMGGHVEAWLASKAVAKWLLLAPAATFGLILLRPHFLVVGLATTLIAWLMQDELTWAPRFVHAVTFFQLVALFGLASVWRAGAAATHAGRRHVAVALGFGLCGAIGWAWTGQLKVASKAGEFYALRPKLNYSQAEIAEADALFAAYRRDADPADPVVAAPWLGRYAHDRNLFWYDRLKGRPKPRWILWDVEGEPLVRLWTFLKVDADADAEEYKLVGESGRFRLFRRYSDAELPPRLAEFPVVKGERYGSVRVRLALTAGRAGSADPVLSLGGPGRGDLFFVRYLDERRLVVGIESIGQPALLSEPIEYDLGRFHEAEFFSASLLPPPGQEGFTEEQRRFYGNLVQVRWDGREVLRGFATPQAVEPREAVIGLNGVRAGSAGERYAGRIESAQRGGYPPGPRADDSGAVRLVLELPQASAGVPEPLAVVGETGNATLAYIRLLPDGRAQLGAEFWSIGAYECEPFAVDRSRPLEVELAFPALFPAPDNWRWGGTPAAIQEKKRRTLRISVNGVVVFEREVSAPIPPQVAVVYGRNSVGGSWVSPAFTGKILQAERLWPGSP